MKKLILILLPILCLACGNKSQNILSEQEKEVIVNELKSYMNQIIDNNESGNPEKALELYLDSPDFISISNGVISDYETFVNTNKQFFSALDSQKYSNSEMIFTFIDKENVILTWKCTALYRMTGGQELKVDPYAATLIFSKVNEDWKIIYGHGSGQFTPLAAK